MPQRFTIFTSFFQHLLEGTILGSLAVWQGFKLAITDQEWGRMTGPNGVAFVAVVAVIVLWSSLLIFIRSTNLKEEKRRKEELDARAAEESERERRHVETVAMQKENSEKLFSLVLANHTESTLTRGAIGSLDSTIKNLTMEMKERPCQIPPLPKIPLNA